MGQITENQLRVRQGYTLEMKIELAKDRIRKWVDEYGEEGVYISFSGGKDSTVLLHLVRSIFPDTPAVFSNTGLEYPEIVEFVNSIPNVTTVRPKKSFKWVIENKGYPVVTKSQAMSIRKVRTQNLSEKYRNKLLYGDEKGNAGKIADKWHYLLDAPFKISEECCNELKHKPFERYKKESGRMPIVGTMTEESQNRKTQYKQHGCLHWGVSCNPLSIWTEQDILEYLVKFDVPYSSIYGDIVVHQVDLLGNRTYKTTGEKRTG